MTTVNKQQSPFRRSDQASCEWPLVYLLLPDAWQETALVPMLHEGGYRTRQFASLPAYRAAVAGEPPAAVVVDLALAPGSPAEQVLTLDPGTTPPVPLIAVSGDDRLESRLEALSAGAGGYLPRPVDPLRLLELLDGLALSGSATPCRVLLVDDEPVMLKAMTTVLRGAGMEVQALSEPLRTLDALREFVPDVLLLDVYMPEVDGPELAAVLRQDEPHLPILFLSGETDVAQQLRALGLGGDDFLVKPVDPDHLVAAIRARTLRARRVRQMDRRLRTTLYKLGREHLAINEHAIVSIADRAGNITYVNDKLCEISGYTRAELMGRNHRMLKSGEHSQAFYQTLWHTIASGRVWQGEFCNRRKDGELYWVASTITPFLDEDGVPYQYVSIRTDITQIKRAKASLQHQRDIQRVISEAGAGLLAAVPDQMDDAIEQLLGHSGLHLGADRAYLFLYSRDGEHMSNTHEWCAPGIVPQKARLQQTPLDHLPWWRQRIAAGGVVLVADTAALPPQAVAERAEFEAQGIRSLFAVALQHKGRSIGFIGFDAVRARRDWPAEDMEMLTVLADIVGSALVRVEAEQAAQTHKERLRRGQLFANIGTWEWNVATDELFWTERIAPLFGHPAGDLETNYANFLNAIHPDDRQMVIDAVSATLDHDAPYDVEHRVVWPDGTVHWLLERGAVERDADGRARRMIGVVQDIDGRKRIELALAERERLLSQAQALARLGNWSADLTTGELVWSVEVYRMFGRDPVRFTPTVAEFLAAVHPDDRALVAESEQQARETGRYDVVHRIICPDGSIRHVHELARAEFDTDGHMVRLIGTVQDITERQRDEDERRGLQRQLAHAQKMEAIGQLTGGLAHDFNNILASVLGFTELAQEQARELGDETLDDYLAQVARGGVRARDLVAKLLAFSRGGEIAETQPVRLDKLIPEIMTLLRPMLPASVMIRLEFDDDLPEVLLQPLELQQVMMNLCINARDAMQDTGTLTINARRVRLPETVCSACFHRFEGDYMELSVADTGVGMAAETQARLFEPFFTTKAVGKGTGMGLPMVHGMVHERGSHILVESAPGKGSRFRLFFEAHHD